MKKKIFKVAIDSPAAAGAGTQAKLIANHYNLIHLDTGKIYRLIGKKYIQNKNKINKLIAKKLVSNLKIKDLNKKDLTSDKIGTAASIVAKKKYIRKIVFAFQRKIAYFPPKKYDGSVLDGRDCTSVIVPDADFKFFITANLDTRVKRRYLELKQMNSLITYSQVLKSIKKRDKSDINRKISPLKKTKDSILINTSNLTKKACFLKIKKIMDNKNNNANL